MSEESSFRLCSLAVAGRDARCERSGQQGHAVLPEDHLDLALTPVERVLQQCAQGLVALSHADGDRKGERQAGLLRIGGDRREAQSPRVARGEGDGQSPERK